MTTITYRYEGNNYVIRYNLLDNPRKFMFNNAELQLPNNWNTMSEEDKSEWYNDPDFCTVHDQYLTEDMVGEFAGIFSCFVFGLCDTLLNRDPRIARLNNATCNFDTMELTLENGEIYDLPGTGTDCIMFDINTILG